MWSAKKRCEQKLIEQAVHEQTSSAHETKYKPGKYIFIVQIHQFVKFNNFTVQQKRNDHSLLGPSWLCPCFGCQQIPVVHLLLAGRLM